MEYSEFKALDVLNAYYDFVSVDDAKYLGYIPEEFHSIISSKCDCHSDRITTSSGSVMTCCDPRCYIKLGYSLHSMLSYFGVRDVGEETCKKMMKMGIREGILTLPSHVEVLYKFEEFRFLLGAKYNNLLEVVAKIHTSSLNFHHIVRAVSIPGFDTKCVDYFGDINNSDELLSEFKKYGVVNTMANRRVFDLKKCLNLIFYMKDVVLFEKAFQGKLYAPALKNVKICITGPVNPEGMYMNRKEFVRYCNEISSFGENKIFEISEGGPSTSPYVIADAPSGSSKYNTAVNREMDNPGLKVIYSSTEFVNLIRDEVNKCKTIMEAQESQ